MAEYVLLIITLLFLGGTIMNCIKTYKLNKDTDRINKDTDRIIRDTDRIIRETRKLTDDGY